MTRTTSNPPAVVDDTAFIVRRTIRIAAPPQKVWSAVTEPEHISRWFGRVELDGAGAGARGTMSFPERTPIPLLVEAIDPPRTVTYRWNNDDADEQGPEDLDVDRSTAFTFTLEPVSGGTQLTVVESGFEKTSDPTANLQSHRDGWGSELDKLVALLEGDS